MQKEVTTRSGRSVYICVYSAHDQLPQNKTAHRSMNAQSQADFKILSLLVASLAVYSYWCKGSCNRLWQLYILKSWHYAFISSCKLVAEIIQIMAVILLKSWHSYAFIGSCKL
jgi:hypothetical protein